MPVPFANILKRIARRSLLNWWWNDRWAEIFSLIVNTAQELLCLQEGWMTCSSMKVSFFNLEDLDIRQHLSFYVNWSDKSVLSSVMPKSPPSHFFLVLSSSNDAPNFFLSRFMGFRKTLHYFLNIAVDSHCCYAIQVFNAMRLCKLIYALWCKTETDGSTGILSEAPIPRHRYHGCLYQYRSRLRTHENISIGIGII